MFALEVPGEANAERRGCVTRYKAQELQKPSMVSAGRGVCDWCVPRFAPFADGSLWVFSPWGRKGAGKPLVPMGPSTSSPGTASLHPVLPGMGDTGWVPLYIVGTSLAGTIPWLCLSELFPQRRALE